MDLTSYLLGKNASSGGGGGDLSQYFDTEITSNTTTSSHPTLQTMVKKTPPITVGENVTDLSYCFRSFANVELDLSQFDTKNVTKITGLFYQSSLHKIDISNLDTSKVSSGSQVFDSCSQLIELICNNLIYSTKYVDQSYKFKNLYKLAKLDISKFDTSSPDMTTKYTDMFLNCGRDCLQSDGAYADGIPYVYVKDAAAQNWVLNTSGNGCPATWTTNNVVIKQ